MHDFVCDSTLYNRIKANLDTFEIQQQPTTRGKRAAVAITIVDIQANPEVYDLSYKAEWASHAGIVLTKRAAKLKKHAGQWALPGGRTDEGESPEEAALRELSEEVGLDLGHDQIIGRLDDYSTRSGFTITPIVVWGGAGTELTPNRNEVAAIYRIPLVEFMRTDAPILEQIPESEHPVLLMPVGNSWIAAPTGAMLYQFREVAILGQTQRVAHFEQPYFAWR